MVGYLLGTGGGGLRSKSWIGERGKTIKKLQESTCTRLVW